MGVEFMTCDFCGEIFSDFESRSFCSERHLICEACSTKFDTPHYRIESKDCPVCQNGGTPTELLRKLCTSQSKTISILTKKIEQLEEEQKHGCPHWDKIATGCRR